MPLWRRSLCGFEGKDFPQTNLKLVKCSLKTQVYIGSLGFTLLPEEVPYPTLLEYRTNLSGTFFSADYREAAYLKGER